MGVIGRRRFLRLTALAAASGVSGLALAARAGMPAKGRVVIVGGGFAGSACALQLRRLDASIDVSLIDPLESYVTCPMSNEVLTGLRDLASITVSRGGVRRVTYSRWVTTRDCAPVTARDCGTVAAFRVLS